MFAQTITPVISAFIQSPRPELTIADKDVARFFSAVRPALDRVAELKIDPALMNRYHFTKPEKKVYYDRFRDGIAARIQFQYDDHLLNPAFQPSGLLKNGTFLSLKNNEMRSVAQLIEELDINDHEIKQFHIKLPQYRALYLDQVTRDRELQLQRNTAF